MFISLAAGGGAIQDEVEYNGTGVDCLDAWRFFERLFRGKGPPVLALPVPWPGPAFVKELVTQQNGRI
jgi:hypothetical protein